MKPVGLSGAFMSWGKTNYILMLIMSQNIFLSPAVSRSGFALCLKTI